MTPTRSRTHGRRRRRRSSTPRSRAARRSRRSRLRTRFSTRWFRRHTPWARRGSRAGRSGGASVTVAAPVAQDGTLTLVVGDDYDLDEGRQLDFTEASASTWPTLTGATIKFTVRDFDDALVFAAAGSVVTATGFPKKVRAELPDT